MHVPDVIETGKCTYNGRPFNVVSFKLEKNNRYYDFCTAGERCTACNMPQNDHQILTNDDVPRWINAEIDYMRREHLYNHLHAAGMFLFGVSFDGVEQNKYSAPGQGEQMSKVLHWDIARSQLTSDLLEKGFELSLLQAGDRPIVTVNTTAFDGLPSRFAQEYRGIAYGVMSAQFMKLRLWEANPKNAFLDILKNEPTWKTAAHKK